ncbi:MAG: hypothetical protein JW870_13560 [Candidatus Delongbacteria bacterium]|nr:hypothetical protein [Candidatus Delongbacteria bacterium]
MFSLMANYGSDRRGGRNRRGSDRPEMFDAICDKCGSECKVPFHPSGDKPVYCSECFEQVEADNPRSDRRSSRGGGFRGDRRDSRGGGSSDMMKKMDFMERKLDRILELLEK